MAEVIDQQPLPHAPGAPQGIAEHQATTAEANARAESSRAQAEAIRAERELRDTEKANRPGLARRGVDAAKEGGRNLANATKEKAGAAKEFWNNPANRAVMKNAAMKTGKFAVGRVLPGIGIALLADDAYQLVAGQVPIRHHQPEVPRTQFLPVARNGHMDNPHGDAPNSVDSMDAKLVEMNEKTFQFDPPSVCSYCEDGCDEGCNPVTARALELNPDTAVEPLEKWAEALSDINSIFTSNEGEMWADRLAQVYGAEGSAKLPDLLDQTDAVAQALREAVKASDEMGQHAIDALRTSIKAGRDEMQQRVDDENSLFGWLGDFFTHRRGDNALDHLQEKLSKVTDAQAENDAAVKKLNDALAAWNAKEPNKDGGGGDDKKPGTTPHKGVEARETKPDDPSAPGTDTPLPGDTTTPGTDTPLPGDTTTPDDDLDKKLKDLLNSQPSDNPFGGSPLGGGMPGGGMPSMPSMGGGGGDPFGGAGAPPLGGGEDPFTKDAAADPLDDKEDPFKDDKEGEDDKDGDKDGDDDDKGDKKVEDPDVPGDATPPGDVTPPVAGDGNVPDVHSDDVQARTVTLPDGRAITFPDAKTADMVRAMVSAEDGAPKSVYSAASEAGFNLPPMGQDIGEKVQPDAMQPGDIVAGDNNKSGVYLGGDDVLLEDKSICKLADMGEFNGANQGVFHLDSGGAGGDPAPAQPMGSGADLHSGEGSTSTPGAPTEQAGSPGVPTDDTSASAAPGGSSESTTGLNPSTAFPS